MLIRRILGTTHILGQPETWDIEKHGKCMSLPARVDPVAETISSAWEPTPAELAALMAGASVILTVYGNVQPPVSITVEDAT